MFVTVWFRSRILPAMHFYQGVTALLFEYLATEHGVTHAVVPTDLAIWTKGEFREVYSNPDFRIIEVINGQTPP